MGGLLTWLVGNGAEAAGKGVAAPIEAIGNVFDKLFTSDEEKAAAEIVKAKLAQHPAELQVELNKIEAGSGSVFVAGWRPYIGWILGTALGMFFLPQYALAAYLWARQCLMDSALQPYPITADAVMELVLAMLGMATIRTVDKKINGK